MTTVGILSDTHGVLRPEVLERLEGCDAVIHAGDFADRSVFDELQRLTRLYAVRGNNDWRWENDLPECLDFSIEGLRFTMAHDRRQIRRDLSGIDAAIFGHTHSYFEQVIGGRLWLNPGSCGRPYFGKGLSFALMRIDGASWHIERRDLPARPMGKQS